MKLQYGKICKLRDGRVTEPLSPNFAGSPYPFVALVEGERRTWDANGLFSSSAWVNCPADIVEVLP